MHAMTRWIGLMLIILCSGAAVGQNLDASVNQLALGLADDIRQAGLKHVGVPEFANSSGNLGGDTGAAGHYFAEKVEGRLVKASQGAYEVIERRRLNAVLEEGKVQVSGLTDEQTSQQLLGKIKGLDGLVVGSLTRIGRRLSITGKIVRLPDAGIVGSESVEIPLDPDLLTLFGENVSVPVPGGGERVKPGDMVDAAVRPVRERPVPELDPNCPYGLEVLVDGRAKPLHQKGGSLFIPASKGEVFQIRLSNRSGTSVGVALFIDGLNSIGQKRELPSTARKWVLSPGQTAIVPGWQMDLTHARQFVFVGLEESLAARQRFTDQIGLITAAFYPELSAAEETRGVLGTGEGEQVESRVREVDFRGSDVPAAILTLHYDSSEVVGSYERITK